LLTYRANPDALVQLRKEFEDGGFREQERKITYALKRREAELSCQKCMSRKLSKGRRIRESAKGKRKLNLDEETANILIFFEADATREARAIVSSSDSIVANCGSFVLNRVFFDWTCQYGMSPGRALIVALMLWLVCSLIYFACIHTRSTAGLYRIYGPNIHEDPSARRRIERISRLVTGRSSRPRWLVQSFWRECLLLRTSMFFSLMSAFNIGFRDINFGRWLRLLTRQEFDIKAVGWVRVVAGWQSLISVYLIALWVLTYFGRPFG